MKGIVPSKFLLLTLLTIPLLMNSLFSILAIAENKFEAQILNVKVYSDGVVQIHYVLKINSSLLNVSLPLFGSQFEGFIIVDENSSFLDYSFEEEVINVQSLGANSLTIIYNSQELTNKTGQMWTFSIDTSINFTIAFPADTTILSLSQMPLEIRSEDGYPVLIMPEGFINISFIMGIVGPGEQAFQVISNAEDIISKIRKRNIIMTDAEIMIVNAKNAFELGNYTEAETLANQAILLAQSIEKTAEAANSTINEVENMIIEKRREGKTEGINKAENLLQLAKTTYGQGEYSKAFQYAEESKKRAQEATTPFPTFLIVGAVILFSASIGFTYLYTKRNKGRINVEKILRRNQWLRPEQRSVILLLAKNENGVFEAEIRRILDLPKSSVWRIIKKLEKESLVEVNQVRGQNHVKIIKNS